MVFLASLCLLKVVVGARLVLVLHLEELDRRVYEFEGALVLLHSKHFVLYPWGQGDKELGVGSFATSYQEPGENGLPTHLLELGDDLVGAKEGVHLLDG